MAGTREGYLYAWATPGKATANNQWWTALATTRVQRRQLRRGQPTPGGPADPGSVGRHPPRPPSPPRAATGTTGRWAVTLVTFAPTGAQVTVSPSGPAGTHAEDHRPHRAPPGCRCKPQDADGNLGPTAVFGTAPPAPNTGAYLESAANGTVFPFGGATPVRLRWAASR